MKIPGILTIIASAYFALSMRLKWKCAVHNILHLSIYGTLYMWLIPVEEGEPGSLYIFYSIHPYCNHTVVVSQYSTAQHSTAGVPVQ